MFRKTCYRIREAVYGFSGRTQLSSNQINCSIGTAFMIAPGVIVTAAHLIHLENNLSLNRHQLFEGIRAPDIGQPMETVTFIAEDVFRDIAFLRLENPRSDNCVKMESKIVRIGTNCGSLGFPLGSVRFSEGHRNFTFVERFQGANISAFVTTSNESGRHHSFYETDSLMYRGSSGCPGFLRNSEVFGMHTRSIVEPRRENSGASSNIQRQRGTRLAISLWVPSMDIIAFAEENGIRIR